jgi:outer membrane protein assembly factor BamB
VGKGYSAPSIIDNHLVLHHRVRDRDLIEAFRADDGTKIWTYDYETDFSDPYGYNNGPRCSPLLTKDRCYTFGAQGRLVCLDLKKGTLIWERKTAEEWKVPEHFFGAGCTPIVIDGLLIVLVGGQPNSGVVAFDGETGRVVWEAVGKKTWDGVETDQPGRQYKWTGEEMIVSYSSPIIATIHGEKHLLCLLRHGLVSLDPANGNLRFKYWFRSRAHESVNAARPVVIEDQIFLSAAYETGAALLRVKPSGTEFDVVWRNKGGMSTHWSTPIHHEGYLYGFSGRHERDAMLQCVDLKTGDLLWETNGFEGKLSNIRWSPVGDHADASGKPVTFFGRGSKIAADGKYFMLGEGGILALAKLDSKKYELISRVKYDQMRPPSWTAPVLSHGRLYLRCENSLMCLDVAKPVK